MPDKSFSIKNYDLKNPIEKKEYNDKLFKIVAPKYDIVTVVLSFGFDRLWKKKLLKSLPEISNPFCLDLATGSGDIAILLSKRYPSSTITAIDLKEEMLEIARKKSTHYKNIKYELGNMEQLEFKPDSFDIVTGSYALRNTPDLNKTLNDIYKFMKVGSTAAFLDFSKPENKILQNIELFFLKFWGMIWGLVFHGKPEVYGYLSNSLKVYPDRIRLKGLLQSIGFVNIKSTVLFLGFLEIVTFKKS